MANEQEHATVNDALEAIWDGNVYLAPNRRADIPIYEEVEWSPSGGPPDTVNIDFKEPNGLYWDITVPPVTTHGHVEDPDYEQYWNYLEFKDGSKLGYFYEVEYSTGTIPMQTYRGGAIKFMHKLDDGTFETSYGGFWGGYIDPTFSYYVFNNQDPDWPQGSPQPMHWYVEEEIMLTNQDEYRVYLYYWNELNVKMGYGIAPKKINTRDISILYGTDSKNYPCIQWGFSNGWTMFYDYLAGLESEGEPYLGNLSINFYNIGDDATYGDNGTAPIPVPGVPSIQAIDLGFTNLYNPSEADIRAMSRWLWDSDFATNVKKNFMSPFENILSLAIAPVRITCPNTRFLTIGNIDSDISMHIVEDQYIEHLYCGSIQVDKYWDNFMDYDDVNFTLWLPFVGFRSIRAVECVGCTVSVYYNIDLLTGSATCFVCNNKYFNEDTVLYSYTCNVLQQIPISGANYMSMYNQQLSATANGSSNWVSNMVSAVGQVASGNLMGAASTLFGANQQAKLAKRQYDTAKPEYGRGGSFGGTTGLFATRFPYLVKSRPDSKIPFNYNNYEGIPAFVTDKLANLSGYTEIQSMDLNMPWYELNRDGTVKSVHYIDEADKLLCTQEELNEIEQLLMSGVYL